jgi:hypothetical protein
VKEVAGTIPIVMSVVGDAVALGYAQSLAHPGGNLTGQTILSTDVIGKRLQMLLEIVPDPGCVGVLGRAGVNYDNASHELAAAAKALGVLLPITVADANDLATRFAEIAEHCRALVAMSEPLFLQESRQLIELAGQFAILKKGGTHQRGVSMEERMLKLFAYGHLEREDLQAVSKPFHDLAHQLVAVVPAGPERTVSLRKGQGCRGPRGRHPRMSFARTFECSEPVPIRQGTTSSWC